MPLLCTHRVEVIELTVDLRPHRKSPCSVLCVREKQDRLAAGRERNMQADMVLIFFGRSDARTHGLELVGSSSDSGVSLESVLEYLETVFAKIVVRRLMRSSFV
jgi:hypothetical protein